MRKKKDNSSDAANDLIESLFGPVEDLSNEELDAILAEAGIDFAGAKRALYARVSDLRSEFWAKNADVPSQITNLLAQLRPIDLPSSDPVIAQRQAGSWVGDLLGKVPSSSVELAFAARGRDGELSDADDKVRQELERELEDAVRRDRDKG